MSLEDEFKEEVNGEIPEADSEKLATVGDVISYLKEKAGS
jgi:acyl carrier protein